MLAVFTAVDSFVRVKPGKAVRVATVAALGLAWFSIGESVTSGAVSTLEGALTLMLYFLVPWTAVNLADYFWVRRGDYRIEDLFSPDGVYGR